MINILEKGDTFVKLLYCYILFLDEKGKEKPHRGLHHVELNLSTMDRFIYDASTNTLRRKDRKAPLPIYFWSYKDLKPEDCNIYNVNVIAGENGSGKTTAIRSVINLLDFFHAAADDSNSQEHPRMSYNHRALLILEDNGVQYLLDYSPAAWKTNTIQTKGFSDGQLYSFTCWSRDAFTRRQNDTAKKIASLLQKTKVVYLTNTITQYDYERHIRHHNAPLRDFFIYDASIGASIGPDLVQFFPYEVYKQVKYVFNPLQVKKRDMLKKCEPEDCVPEIRIPHTLSLRLRLDQYNDAFSRYSFPTALESMTSGKGVEHISYNDLEFPELLGILCVASFVDNVNKSFKKANLIEKTDDILFPQRQEFKNQILKTELQFYYAMRSCTSLTCHTDSITCLSILPEKRLVSGSRDCSLRVWDSNIGECLQIWKGHFDSITCIANLPNGQVVSGSHDRTLRVWNINSEESLQTLSEHTESVTCVAVLQDGRIVSGSNDKTIRVWDANTGTCQRILKGHTGSITCLTILPDGQIVSGSLDCTVRVWDVRTNTCIEILKGHAGSITCLLACSDGRIISGSMDNTLRVWHSNVDLCLSGHYKAIRCVTVLPDGRIVSGSDDHTLRIWDAHTGQCLHTMGGHSSSINCVAFLPDGHVASGSWDCTLRIWDIDKGTYLYSLRGHSGKISCLTVLSDGRIVSGSKDNSILIWETEEGTRKLNPDVHILMKHCLDYIDYVYDKYESFFSRFTRINENTFELSLDVIKPREDDKSKNAGKKVDGVYKEIIEFVQKYLSICKYSYSIDFEWGMSSGEENMLRIFSNLYHIFDWDYKIYNNETHTTDVSKKTICDTLLLFMDEADLTFHPEWQRRLVGVLTAYIPQIYPASCAKDIQLILSTHSPLILGDIPCENITYLYAKDIQSQDSKPDPAVPGETFGQNIHTILKENFFLSKGTVGAFAARKINEAAKELVAMKGRVLNEQDQEKLSALRQTIRLVAPGILRTQLELLIRDLEDDEEGCHQEEIKHLLEKWTTLSVEKRQKLLNILEQEGKADD